MTRLRTLFYTVISIFIAGAGTSVAKTFSLRECVDSALVANPSVTAAALMAEKARLMKGTAFNPPMTEILLKQETTGGGGPENGVAFSQDFDFPTVYTSRYRSLSALAELETARFNLVAKEVEREVTGTFYSALYYKRLMVLNRELDAVYEDFLNVARARFEAGECSRLEVLNAERVRSQNDMEHSRLALQLEGSLADLCRLTSCDVTGVETSGGFGPYLKDLPVTEPSFEETVRARVSEYEVKAAEKEVGVARNEFMPGLKVGATVQALIRGFNPYNVERERFRPGNFMGFEVGVTVPLFFGAPMSRLKAARAELRATELKSEAARSEETAELEKLRSSLRERRIKMDYYNETAVPKAEEIKRLAIVSYQLGEIDYLEYMANIETVFSVLREEADCINEYNLEAISYSIR